MVKMKKVKQQQLLMTVIAAAAVSVLFFFGKTTEHKTASASPAAEPSIQKFDIQAFIDSSKDKLTTNQALYVAQLEKGISRGDVKAQQIKAYNSLSSFWKDSAKLFEPYAYYIYESAKLDNSEKNLTFAAQLFLNNLRSEHDDSKLDWQTAKAIELFEAALEKNPGNDDLRIGLGSCYVFGKGRSGDPQQTMKGIQELLAVVKKDSTNLKAQFVLAVGGYVSGQYDKSIERFMKVVEAQPDNMEAIAFLADTYAAKGDKDNAIKWYNISKRLANNPAYSKEVDERIKMLR